LLTAGEGFHNNHHDQRATARFTWTGVPSSLRPLLKRFSGLSALTTASFGFSADRSL
jgi:hypothetical protein